MRSAHALVLVTVLMAGAAPSVARSDGPAQAAALSGVSGDSIPASLTGVAGDPIRGRAIVVGRQVGLCLLCHSGPFVEERQQGTLATDLAGAGKRWSEGQLRLRLVAPRLLSPGSIMPSYLAVEGRVLVGAPWQGRPLLDPQQIEDVVALLVTLREPR